MQIMEYAKSHPWATGIIVVVGGFIFIMIFKGGGSSSGGGNASRPSDAEIAANATIQAAQIAATAQGTQASAAVQAAQVGAGVQMNSDNKAAEVAMTQINAQKDLGLEYLHGQESVAAAYEATRSAALQSLAQGGFGKYGSVEKANAIASVASGQPVQSTPNNNNSKGTLEQIFGSGGIISTIGSIASIFSDMRLKEHIVLLGYDKNGNGIYEYNYKGSNTRHRGVIAQDVMRSHPEAVSIDPGTGFWKVNQYKLGHL